MLKFSKPLQYALRALIYMSRHGLGTPCHVEDIAAQEKIPRAYLAKLLQQMVKQGFLVSYKGPKGGFVLPKSMENVTLLQIIESFEDLGGDFKTCMLGYKSCGSGENCAFHHHFAAARDRMKSYLKGLSLKELAA